MMKKKYVYLILKANYKSQFDTLRDITSMYNLVSSACVSFFGITFPCLSIQ